MTMVAPAVPVHKAVTMSGNPVATTAGIKALEILQQRGSYDYLDNIRKQLVYSNIRKQLVYSMAYSPSEINVAPGQVCCIPINHKQ